MEQFILFFKALSDETRVKMLAMLMWKKELCVCDFLNVLEITQSKASRHLRYMVHAGILSDRRETIWVYYRVSPGIRDEVKIIISAYKKVSNTAMFDDLKQKLETWLKCKTC